MLVQDRDIDLEERAEMQVVTERRPTEAEWQELSFAWKVCKHVRSNAIVFSRDLATIGIGAGQMSRVDSVRIAIEKARDGVRGAVMASDAYFPFPDSPELALEAGATAIVQPGGSVRDHLSVRGRRPGRRARWCSPAAATSGIDRAPDRRPTIALRAALRLQPGLPAGPFVRVGGTTSVDEYGVVHGETPYEQTLAILRKIEHELGRAGATLDDVIETRIYVTDISRYEEVGSRPRRDLQLDQTADDDGRVSGLIDPRMLVEIEAVAYARVARPRAGGRRPCALVRDHGDPPL